MAGRALELAAEVNHALMSAEVGQRLYHTPSGGREDARDLLRLSRSDFEHHAAAGLEIRSGLRRYAPIEVQSVRASPQRRSRLVLRDFRLQPRNIMVANVRWIGEYQIEFDVRTGKRRKAVAAD